MQRDQSPQQESERAVLLCCCFPKGNKHVSKALTSTHTTATRPQQELQNAIVTFCGFPIGTTTATTTGHTPKARRRFGL